MIFVYTFVTNSVFAQFCQKNLYWLYDLYMYILLNKFERKKKEKLIWNLSKYITLYLA